jgi:hypothetical protein
MAAPDVKDEERRVLDLVGNALALQREGVLDPATVASINRRLADLFSQMRAKGVQVILRGLDYDSNPLQQPTDLPPDLDRLLHCGERILYNHLAKLDGHPMPFTPLQALLESEGVLSADRPVPERIRECMKYLDNLIKMTRSARCRRQVVGEGQGTRESPVLFRLITK